jgi:hypothetical protein
MNLIQRFSRGRNLFLAVMLWLTVHPCLSAAPALSNAAPEEIYQQAYNLYEGGNYQGAVERCKAVLAKEPDHWRAMQVAGYASFQLKDISSAVGYCRRSLIFHPDNPALQEFLDKISQNGVPFPPAEPAQVPPPPWANMTPASSPALPMAGEGPAPQPDIAVHFGFLFGANLSNLTYESSVVSVSDLESRFGLAGGLALRVDFGRVFSLEPELLFSQKGFTESLPLYSFGGNPTGRYTDTTTLNYLEMPLLLKFSVPSGKVRPNIFAGFSAGLFVEGSSTDSVSGTTEPIPSLLITPVETSFIAGLGLDIGRFSISGRFEQGLSGIFSDSPAGALVQNQLFNVMVGFFPI